MAETLQCVRCNLQKPPPPSVPWGGDLGTEIRSKICQDCWTEWEGAEVMVINELRLNFMDPKSQEILIKHMREYLMLGDAS